MNLYSLCIFYFVVFFSGDANAFHAPFSKKDGFVPRNECEAPNLQEYACSHSFDLSRYVMHWRSDLDGVDFMLNVSTNGWVALGFSEYLGSMVPSDAVIFSTDGSSDQPRIAPARIVGRSETDIVFDSDHFRVTDTSFNKVDGRAIIMFRRRFGDGYFPFFLNNSTNLLWAFSGDNEMGVTYHGENRGAMSINFDSSLKSSQVRTRQESGEKIRRNYKIHAWLMWATFTLIIPSGIMFAKFGQTLLAPTLWFYFHIIFQTSGVILATISILYVKFANASTNREINTLHERVGWSIFAILWAQLILGLVRPKIDKKRIRTFWYVLHFSVGIFVIIFAWRNMFWGFQLYDRYFFNPLKTWRIAVLVQIALWSVAYVVFAICQKLISRGKSSEHGSLESEHMSMRHSWEMQQQQIQMSQSSNK